MRFLQLFLIGSLLAASSYGQTSEDSVKAVISNLFRAMKDADSTGIVTVFASDAVLQTIGSEKLRQDGPLVFASSVGRLKKGQLDERIEFGAVLVDANLASVWTPYRLYFDGKFLHCGANSFQLVRLKGDWKIVHLIDTRRKNCD
jgi:hypothetical protein